MSLYGIIFIDSHGNAGEESEVHHRLFSGEKGDEISTDGYASCARGSDPDL